MLVSHSDGVLDVDTDDGDVVVGLVRLGVRLHVRDVHHRLHAAAHAPKHRVLNVGAIISQTLPPTKVFESVFHHFLFKTTRFYGK